MGRTTRLLTARDWVNQSLDEHAASILPGSRLAVEALLRDGSDDAAASFMLEALTSAGLLDSRAHSAANDLLNTGGFGRSSEYASELLNR